MHGKPTEVSASALDALFSVELEAVTVEEWPSRKTGVSGDVRRPNGTQRGLDALVETASHSPTCERGISEEEIKVAVMGVGNKACDSAVRLGNDGVKVRKTLLPAPDIGRDWRPGGNLLW